MKYSRMWNFGLRLVWGDLGHSCKMDVRLVYLIVADLGGEVIVDLSLGKLVRDLCACGYE